MVAVWLEVFFAQAGWDLFQVLLRRPALARVRQRVFVDVRRVDLRPLPIFGGAEGLGAEHGDAVRLLAGRDPGTPHSDRLVRGFALDDPGEDLGSQILPCRGVSKVAR